MRLVVALLALAVVARAYHFKFDEGWENEWVHSTDEKYAGSSLTAEVPPGLTQPALKVPEKARHYGVSTLLPEPVDPSQGLVLQYEVKLAPGGLTCGGAYLKFLTATPELRGDGLRPDTPYSVMFGPDKCGMTNKVHLILRHTSPVTGEVQEKHLKSPPSFPNDDATHVYTAILDAGAGTYAVLIDGVERKAGSLAEDFDPPINPPETIPDPDDKKPEDWVDEPRIADPSATKPEDWDEDAPREVEDAGSTMPDGWLVDEPREVDDPDARMPDDWDEEEDGDWEPPTVPNPRCASAPGCGPWTRPRIPNPAYKGPWLPPMIDNPAYKGPWKARDIANPAHFVDTTPLANIGRIGGAAIEIWTMDSDYFFDNVVVSNDPADAAALRDSVWSDKHEAEEAAAAEKRAAEEAARKKEEKKGKKKKRVSDDDEEEEDEEEEEAAPWTERLVEALFDHPLLEPYADRIAPVRAFCEANPLALPALFGTALALILSSTLGSLLGSGRPPRRPSAVPVPKPKAKPEAKPEAKPDAAAPSPVRKKADAAADAASGDEVEASGDDDSDEIAASKPAGARRRTRRD